MSKQKHKSKRSRLHRLHKTNFATPALAIAVCSLLIIEGALFGMVSGNTVKNSFDIFDISKKFAKTQNNLAVFAEPFANTISSVQTFYILSAQEMQWMLGNNIIEHSISLVEAVDKFYMIASYEMGNIFDLTS
jgi:hypothetical protein